VPLNKTKQVATRISGRCRDAAGPAAGRRGAGGGGGGGQPAMPGQRSGRRPAAQPRQGHQQPPGASRDTQAPSSSVALAQSELRP
jgi:hypothetical protein